MIISWSTIINGDRSIGRSIYLFLILAKLLEEDFRQKLRLGASQGRNQGESVVYIGPKGTELKFPSDNCRLQKT